MGRDGERLVGQYLDELRNENFSVFHDIVGDKFNIDHIVVSTKGIFVIETKTYSKPKRGKATITYDSKKVLIQGRIIEQDVILQAELNQKSLQEIITDKTGRSFPMRSVVLFPGWWIEDKRNHEANAPWILNPKAFPEFHAKLKDVICVQDYQLILKQIKRHIRQAQEKKKLKKVL